MEQNRNNYTKYNEVNRPLRAKCRIGHEKNDVLVKYVKLNLSKLPLYFRLHILRAISRQNLLNFSLTH